MKRSLFECRGVAVLLAVAAMGAMSVSHAAPGDLDPGFGTGGKVAGSFGNPDLPDGYDLNDGVGIARDAAGNLYVGGNGYKYNAVGGGTTDLGVAKFDQAGHLVTSFGNGGRLLVDVGPYQYDTGTALVVAGSYGYIAGNTRVDGANVFAVAKFTLNGQLVASFGSAGVRTVSFGPMAGGFVNALAVDPAGNVFLAGDSRQGGGNFTLTVAKLDSTGALVAGFGSGGIAVVPMGTADGSVYAIALDGSGGVYLAGRRGSSSPSSSAVVVYHLGADGAVDTGFNNGANGGSALFGFPGAQYSDVHGLVRADNGDLYLAGTLRTPLGVLEVGLAKLGANGVLSGDFGTNGRATFGIPDHGVGASSLALDADGNIYVAGTDVRIDDSSSGFLVAQFDGRGNVVGQFGSDGSTTIDFSPQYDTANAMLLDGSGRLYAAGTVNLACVNCGPKLFGVARLFVTPADAIFKSGFEP